MDSIFEIARIIGYGRERFRRTVALWGLLLGIAVAAINIVGKLAEVEPEAWLGVMGDALPWTVFVVGGGVWLFQSAVGSRRQRAADKRREELRAEEAQFGGRRVSANARRLSEATADENDDSRPRRTAAWAFAAVILAMSTLAVRKPEVRGAVDLVVVVVYAWAYVVWDRRGRRVAMKTCPDCAERVKPAARVCRYCGFRYNVATSPGGQTRPDASRLLGVSPQTVYQHRRVVDEFRADGYSAIANWLASCNGVEDLRVLRSMLVRISLSAYGDKEREESERLARVVGLLTEIYGGDARGAEIALLEELRVPDEPHSGWRWAFADWAEARRERRRQTSGCNDAASGPSPKADGAPHLSASNHTGRKQVLPTVSTQTGKRPTD